MNTIHTVSIPLESFFIWLMKWRFHSHPFDWLRSGSIIHRSERMGLIAIG